MSVDSTHFGSDNEDEKYNELVKEVSHPHSSPQIATSPPPLLAHTMSDLSLNIVAEKWARTRESKRSSMEEDTNIDKGVSRVAPVREGLQAKC